MMNEVIIDGVDVSGCEFFEPKAQVMQCHMQAITERCKDNNCYFKQLQRLKKENEELKAITNQVLDDKARLIEIMKFCLISMRSYWDADI